MGKKGEHKVGVFIAILLLSFSALMILDKVTAEKNPPVLSSGGVYETSGDWVVESGDDVIWANSKLIANGNITIGSGGKLSLNNVELKFNSSVDGLYTLRVENGGRFQVIDSIITSQDPSRNFRMVLGGSVLFETVSVSFVHGDPDNPWDHGIELRSSKISILNSTFYRCQGDVLHVESSSPMIKGNHFYENMGAAVYTNGTSSPLISNNEIYRQRFGLVSGFYSSPVIDKNTIYDIDNNGILLNGYMYPRVSNNTIRDCLNGMLLWYSNAILENNLLYNNEAGYNIKVDSRPSLKGDEVRGNIVVGISINDSIVDIVDCDIHNNRYDGIRVFNGSRAKVRSSSIQTNDDDGFQITGAYVELTDSIVDGNGGDQIFLRDSSVIDLMGSTVRGSWGGPAGLEDWHLNIGAGCSAAAFNSEFEEEAVTFGDASSKLTVSYTCSFFVVDEKHNPIPDVTINILNETGYRRALGTGADGQGERYLSHYEQRDLNNDGDGKDPGEMNIHGYTFTIDETGYIPFGGSIDIEGGDHVDVVLEDRPYVNILGTTPDNGDMDVEITMSILVRFDRNIDPSTLDMEIFAPGGASLYFDTSYDPGDLSLEVFPMSDLAYSTTYTVEIRGVAGVSGEKLRSTYYLSFRTAGRPDPDNDEDGIPDREDLDDDNDGFEDVVEEYSGTDPFDPLDFPVETGADDDIDPGTGPDPGDDDVSGDDDDDNGIIIIPGTTVVDDDDDVTDDDLDPLDTTDSMPGGPDEGMNMILLIIGTVFGLLILAGVMVLIFIRGGGGHKLREVEYRPPTGG